MLHASFPHSVTLMQLRLRFARRDQLATGLAPVGVRPCWAHKKNPLSKYAQGVLQETHNKSLASGSALAVVFTQMTLSQANAFRRDLHQFVFVDEFHTVLQCAFNRRRDFHSILFS